MTLRTVALGLSRLKLIFRWPKLIAIHQRPPVGDGITNSKPRDLYGSGGKAPADEKPTKPGVSFDAGFSH
jgi:hypothetical protein